MEATIKPVIITPGEETHWYNVTITEKKINTNVRAENL